MPVVTRSDCTQTNVQEYYKFVKNPSSSGYTSAIDRISLQFQSCQGANNKNNDLEAFVEQLVRDGKLSTAEQDVFTSRVVGDHNCPSATDTFLGLSGFEAGYDIDDTKWTFIVGEGFDDEEPVLDDRIFKEMIEAQEVSIVRRVCPSCQSTHRDIYYRRFTEMPEDFDLRDTLMNNWFDTNNAFNVDFALYSTHLDAYLDRNRWTFCNFNDGGIGFPRDCGPNGRVNNQWNSYARWGGAASHHAFMIPADLDFESEIVHELYPKILGTDYAEQYGTQSSGTTITHMDNNDYLSYASVNFGDTGATKGILVNYSKGNDNGRIEVRLGDTTGTLIANFSPARTGGWDVFQTAYVDLRVDDIEGVEDVTIVCKDVGGCMNLAWFELSDFSDRSGLHADIAASAYSIQSGIRFDREGNMINVDNGD